MTSLAWKVKRLRLMAPIEILWRGQNAVQALVQRYRSGENASTRQVLAKQQQIEDKRAFNAWGQSWFVKHPIGLPADGYVAAAERILDGRFDVFALHDIKLGFPPPWRSDPKTGTVAPLRFGKTLDYRDEKIVGDIKYLWEINRHYELVTLAQAYHLSGQERFAHGCRSMLESWFAESPHPLGQNWSSALENAIRLLNWAVAWHLLGGVDSVIFQQKGEPTEQGEARQTFKQQWLASIYHHCEFISGHFSLHSSANNHLFGEYMGLLIGAITWPCWDASTTWRELAKQGLEREALKQNAGDGVNREHAIWYHHEVADMMLISGIFAASNGIGFSAAYWRRLEGMCEFIHALMDKGGNLPMIGDSDDAKMVRFSQEPGFNVYRSLLASSAVLFQRNDFKEKAGQFDHKSQWLLGQAGKAAFSTTWKSQPGPGLRRDFPEGGYYLLGNAFDTPEEIRIVADAGALGYLSIAAHGHADALAFTMSVAGNPILIDPGTYAYHTQQKWRDYFRGTSAHNTMRVDGLDQSESGGNFMWLSKANAHCEQWQTTAEHDCFVASHDGYARLSDPVLHRRTLRLDKQLGVLQVEDVLECKKSHDIELHWHFSPQCGIRIDKGKALVSCAGVEIEVGMWIGRLSGLAPELVSGQETPPLGWISHHFDEKAAAPTLRWKETIRGNIKRVTVFKINRFSMPA